MNNIFFTADTHFNHAKIIELCHRPFENVKEMDETMIENWNHIVKQKDTVYLLGDFAYGKNDEVKKLRYRLNGKIHLILGNHDYQNKIQRLTNIFSSMNDLLTFKYNKKYIVLCHYPLVTWDKQKTNSFQLHGHCHGNLKTINKYQMDVGVDCNNFYPVSIEQVNWTLKGCL